MESLRYGEFRRSKKCPVEEFRGAGYFYSFSLASPSCPRKYNRPTLRKDDSGCTWDVLRHISALVTKTNGVCRVEERTFFLWLYDPTYELKLSVRQMVAEAHRHAMHDCPFLSAVPTLGAG